MNKKGKYSPNDVFALINAIELRALEKRIDFENIETCRAITVHVATENFNLQLLNFIIKHFTRQYGIEMECYKHEYEREGESFTFLLE